MLFFVICLRSIKKYINNRGMIYVWTGGLAKRSLSLKRKLLRI